MGWCRKNPRCSTPQPTRKSTIATSVAATANGGSTGRDQLAGSVLIRGSRLGPPRGTGCQHDERGEGEEPGDVEVEPVREGELEADQDGRGQRGELERRLAAGDEVAGDRPGHEQSDDDLLEPAEVGDSGRVVLPPAPDRERRVAADLPAQRAVPEHPRRVGR